MTIRDAWRNEGDQLQTPPQRATLRTLTKKLRGEDWTAVTVFSNSWVNFGGSTFAPASYYIDALGIVHLRGAVKNGNIAGGTIFTLPEGYRPEYNHVVPVMNASGTLGQIQVYLTGEVKVDNLPGGNTYLALDGVTFRAYQ